MLDLEKRVEKGTFRWLGQNYNSLTPQNTIIAGLDLNTIGSTLQMKLYKIGRYKTKNVFIAYDGVSIFYIYVRPSYKYYRKVFTDIVGDLPEGFHVDHILARNLAERYKYNYVLICMIPDTVNIQHGQLEKLFLNNLNHTPNFCLSDDRIYDKILSRKITDRKSFKGDYIGYNPADSPAYGLTLKQKGIWNRAFGFDRINKENFEKKITLLELNKLALIE